MQERYYFRIYAALLGLSLLLAVAAALTLVPATGASWPNVLGYKSLCTFAPIATVILALLAEAVCVIRGRLFGPRRGVKRPWTAPVLVAALLAGSLFFSVPAYVRAKADSTSAASLDAGNSIQE